MNLVFADTLYWYGRANSHDQWHRPVQEARARLGTIQLATTEEVLIEFLAAMSGGGEYLRRVAVEMVQTIQNDPTVRVMPQTHFSFLRGLDLYARRLD